MSALLCAFHIEFKVFKVSRAWSSCNEPQVDGPCDCAGGIEGQRVVAEFSTAFFDCLVGSHLQPTQKPAHLNFEACCLRAVRQATTARDCPGQDLAVGSVCRRRAFVLLGAVSPKLHHNVFLSVTVRTGESGHFVFRSSCLQRVFSWGSGSWAACTRTADLAG